MKVQTDRASVKVLKWQNKKIHMRGWTVLHNIQPKAPECVKVLRRKNKKRVLIIITEKQRAYSNLRLLG